MPTVSTVNVNGVRAAAPKGLARWLAGTAADVVCLQETRAALDEVPAGLFDGWHVSWAENTLTRGRGGVALLTREPPQAVRVGIGAAEFDDAGRYVEADLPGVTVASLYLPNGTVGTPRQDEKDRFRALFAPYLTERRAKAAAEDREVLVCGDWNCPYPPRRLRKLRRLPSPGAPGEADMRNWRGNRRSSGFLPEEREWVAGLLASGWVDVVRELHPGVDGPYSWWSYRGRAFDNNTGWRIDLQLATPGLAAGARTAVVERAPSHPERWSDHAPVTVGYA
ncbi:exodeoxyribonuclease III [Pseudonocardia sp. CNS-139]|nr:exodeoxyribonuclease III [Pseudonocardia sp. CNS-139]